MPALQIDLSPVEGEAPESLTAALRSTLRALQLKMQAEPALDVAATLRECSPPWLRGSETADAVAFQQTIAFLLKSGLARWTT